MRTSVRLPSASGCGRCLALALGLGCSCDTGRSPDLGFGGQAQVNRMGLSVLRDQWIWKETILPVPHLHLNTLSCGSGRVWMPSRSFWGGDEFRVAHTSSCSLRSAPALRKQTLCRFLRAKAVPVSGRTGPCSHFARCSNKTDLRQVALVSGRCSREGRHLMALCSYGWSVWQVSDPASVRFCVSPLFKGPLPQQLDTRTPMAAARSLDPVSAMR